MNGETFLDRIPCGILKLKTDEDLTILYSNQAIKALFQAPASLQDMVCESEYPELQTEIRSHLTGEAASCELEFKAKIQKSCIWCSLQLNYIPEEEILYCAISDITCMKKFQEQLRIREEQYRLASRHSGCLVSIYDIPSRTLSPSPEFSRTFPFPYTQPLSPEFLIENGIVHKESVTDFLEFYDDMEKGIPEGKCITRLKIFRRLSLVFLTILTGVY